MRPGSGHFSLPLFLLFCLLPSALSEPCRIAFGTELPLPLSGSGFHPIPLPAGAVMRGLFLSGTGCMSQVDGAGETNWGGKKLVWSQRYNLETGCTLLNTISPVVIEAGPGKAFVDSHTTAVVHHDGRATRFVNFTDRHRNSMKVIFGKHYVDLDPGFELVLVSGEHLNPKQVAVQESIGWRDMRQIQSDGLLVFLYRVSTSDMLSRCKIYEQLRRSPLAVDRSLRQELLKSAAALETMFNKRKGPFKLDPYKYGSDERKQTADASKSSQDF